ADAGLDLEELAVRRLELHAPGERGIVDSRRLAVTGKLGLQARLAAPHQPRVAEALEELSRVARGELDVEDGLRRRTGAPVPAPGERALGAEEHQLLDRPVHARAIGEQLEPSECAILVREALGDDVERRQVALRSGRLPRGAGVEREVVETREKPSFPFVAVRELAAD